jgi:hypothetical protein
MNPFDFDIFQKPEDLGQNHNAPIQKHEGLVQKPEAIPIENHREPKSLPEKEKPAGAGLPSERLRKILSMPEPPEISAVQPADLALDASNEHELEPSANVDRAVTPPPVWRSPFNPDKIFAPSGVQRSFPRELAREYGINVAIVSGLIGVKCSQRRTCRDGRYWYYNSVRTIQKKVLPYLTENQIRLALEKAVKSGLVVKENYNRLPGDRTGWYSAEPALTKAINDTKVSFLLEDALQLGLDAAIVLQHVRLFGGDTVMPSRLARYLPLSAKRIRRALELLQKRDLL